MYETTKFQTVPFPSYDQPKTKDWYLNWCKSIKSNFVGVGSQFWFSNNNGKYYTLRSYATGTQNKEKYKKQVECKDSADNSLTNLNWDIAPFLPKFVNIIIAKIDEIKHIPNLVRQDSIGVDEKRQFEAYQKAQILLSDYLQKMEALSGTQLQDKQSSDMPQDMDELEAYMELEYKDGLSMGFETALNLELEWNNYEQKIERVRRDLVTVGVGGLKTYTDSNGNPQIRRILPEHAIVSNVRDNDFSDLTYAGEIRYLTMEQIMKESKQPFSRADLELIKTRYTSLNVDNYANFYHPNYFGLKSGLSVGQEVRMAVADLEWYSLDEVPSGNSEDEEESKEKQETSKYEASESKIKQENSKGYIDLSKDNKEESYNEEDAEVKSEAERGKDKKEKKYYKTIHKASHIIGTEIVYNYGLMNDMVRNAENPEETKMSFQLYAPIMENGIVNSLVEQLIPYADLMQLTWLRFQQALMSFNPNQVAIDIDALVDTSVDFGGVKMKPQEILNMFFQKGVLVYSGRALDGRPNAKPIMEVPSDAHQVIKQFYDLILGFVELIRMASGVNEVTDASTPTPNALNGTSQIAIQATNNALRHYFKADERIFINTCKDLVERITDCITYYKGDRYKDAMGDDTIQFLKDNADKPLPCFGIKVTKKQSEEEKQILNQFIMKAVEEGTLDITDVFAIQSCATTKQAQRLMAVRMKRKIKLQQQMQQQQMEQNTQAQAQAAQAAEQAKVQAAQQLIELEVQKAQALAEIEKEKMSHQHSLNVALEREKLKSQLTLTKAQGLIDEELEQQNTERDIMLTELQAEYELRKAKIVESMNPKPESKSPKK